MPRRLIDAAAVAGFLATIPAANWLIGHVGVACVPQGPCLIPVAPGLMAPSGVLVIGLALVLRDIVHERLGPAVALGAIALGGVLSMVLAPPALVVASAAAFVFAEVVDLLVYAPLRRRRLAAAVLLSGLAGAVVDSALFLLLAFGSLDYLAGQVTGKLWATLAALPALWLWRRRLA